MGNLNVDKKELHNNYDNEPVFYCKHCLSLKITHVIKKNTRA